MSEQHMWRRLSLVPAKTRPIEYFYLDNVIGCVLLKETPDGSRDGRRDVQVLHFTVKEIVIKHVYVQQAFIIRLSIFYFC